MLPKLIQPGCVGITTSRIFFYEKSMFSTAIPQERRIISGSRPLRYDQGRACVRDADARGLSLKRLMPPLSIVNAPVEIVSSLLTCPGGNAGDFFDL
jgi:hypothetical protein